LPSSGNSVNDAYIVDADGDLYVWNGAAWESVGQIVGPTGPTGATGDAGDLSDYVPYTGATDDLDLGTNAIIAGYGSQLGSADQYFKIEELDLGAYGSIPMIKSYK
jgi:hypothetical protein